MAAPDTLAIDVWQFVRIMVALESGARKRRRPSGAYAAWRDIWRELDERLTELGKTDATAFSELMMDQQVVLPVPRPEVVRDAVQAIESVTRDMTRELERGGDPSHQEDLRFERKALNALARKLAGRGGSRRRGPTATRSKAATQASKGRKSKD